MESKFRKIVLDNKIYINQKQSVDLTDRFENEYAYYIQEGYQVVTAVPKLYLEPVLAVSHSVKALYQLNGDIGVEMAENVIKSYYEQEGVSIDLGLLSKTVFSTLSWCRLNPPNVTEIRRVVFKPITMDYSIERKRDIAAEISREYHKQNNLSGIIGAIESLIEVGQKISLVAIAKSSGVSSTTVKRYLDNTLLFDYEEYNSKLPDSINSKIDSAVNDIHFNDGLVITKMRVHLKSEISRPTIDKVWDSVEGKVEFLNELL